MKRFNLPVDGRLGGAVVVSMLAALSCSVDSASKTEIKSNQGGRAGAPSVNPAQGGTLNGGASSGGVVGAAGAGRLNCAASGLTECAGACVDVRRDVANCGLCGYTCPAESTCEVGNCKCTDANKRLCDVGCTDTKTDPNNCGNCGTVCGESKLCVGGVCVCGKAASGVALTQCGGFCRDTTTNNMHCGGCSVPCTGGGKSCVMRECGATDTNCVARECDGTDASCVAGQVVGKCLCPEGLTSCGDACVNVLSDANHCGGCGAPCVGTGKTCDNGVCRCSEGLTMCGDVCANLDGDSKNCGLCNQACAANTVCSAGKCTGECASTATQCGQSCVDPQTDPFNCGKCGNVCEVERCTLGLCACSATKLLCDGAVAGEKVCQEVFTDPAHCGGCTTQCGAGQACENAKCYCTEAGLTACGQDCANLQSDPKHCGECGIACGEGEVCSGAVCVCATGLDRCSGKCTNLKTDAANCNGCGTACTGGKVCEAGSCVCPVKGASRLPECSTTGCTDITTDATNCGACGTKCPTQTGGSCAESTCVCSGTRSLCTDDTDADPTSDKICADTQTDWRYCGSCSKRCSGATNTCCTGTCTDIRTVTNCGACGRACASGESCCATDGVYACANLKTDVAHCGNCSTACTSGQTCSDGSCAANCPSNVANGVKVKAYTPASTGDRFQVQVQVCNTGTGSLSLSGMKVKYWYTYDGGTGTESIEQQPTGGTVAIEALSPTRTGANRVATLSLASSSSVSAGQCSSTVQFTIMRPSTISVNYVLTNDWSYAAATTLTDNQHVTAYNGSTLVWGIEAC